MKAIVIDAIAREVRTVEIDPREELKAIYREIGCDCMCQGGTLPGTDRVRNTIFVDDEGHVKGREEGFWIKGAQPLCGSGIILGTDFKGESVDCTLDAEQVARHTMFFTWTDDTRPNLEPVILTFEG